MNLVTAESVPLPPASRAAGFYPSPDLADAYALTLPAGTTRDPEALARFMFGQQAPWIHGLMQLRDAVVSLVGLKTSKQLQAQGNMPAAPPEAPAVRRVHFFRIYAQDAQEILLGEDDKHLDFRVTVRCEPLATADAAAGEARLVVSTVVKCHNALGRFYIAVIAPFHRQVVRSSLQRAARVGWPRAA